MTVGALIIPFVIVCSIIVLVVILLPKEQVFRGSWVVVCLTTIPERLSSDWFYNNLQRMAGLPCIDELVLSVPYVHRRTGKTYDVPSRVWELEKNSKLRINHGCADEGPATKVLAPLRMSSIQDDDVLVIIDDDMEYKAGLFCVLSERVMAYREPCVFTMCSWEITGFQGYAGRKETLKVLLQVPHPPECDVVDDDWIQYTIKTIAGVETQTVAYEEDYTIFCATEGNGGSPADQSWPALHARGDREERQKECSAAMDLLTGPRP